MKTIKQTVDVEVLEETDIINQIKVALKEKGADWKKNNYEYSVKQMRSDTGYSWRQGRAIPNRFQINCEQYRQTRPKIFRTKKDGSFDAGAVADFIISEREAAQKRLDDRIKQEALKEGNLTLCRRVSAYWTTATDSAYLSQYLGRTNGNAIRPSEQYTDCVDISLDNMYGLTEDEAKIIIDAYAKVRKSRKERQQ